MHRVIILFLLFFPVAASAEPLFMKDSLGGREFFDTWGIGADIFVMQQDYNIKELDFVIPGLPGVDTDRINVSNDVQNYNLRGDVWVTPFLNVFALAGYIDADTSVDLSDLSLEILGVALPGFGVSYDGLVYGAGFNLVYIHRCQHAVTVKAPRKRLQV